MSNKNFNHNDNESFMEGIYGCLERIETGIIELQKAKPSDSNSVVDNEANETLVDDIKALVANATGLNCRHTDGKLDEQTKVLNSNFSAISEITVPLNDPIYIALLFIFYLSEEGLIFTLNPILPFGNRNVLGEDLDKIFNALEIYYGNWEVYWKITSLCTFDPNTGILKYGR